MNIKYVQCFNWFRINLSKCVLMVNEKIVEQLDFCLGVEGWSTGFEFEVAECETEWCDLM